MRRLLVCCVCGESAGRYHQHWNRDTGFGICRSCVEWQEKRGETAESMRSMYGEPGINYEPAKVEP